jgi:RNA polymerase primary sigma factor
VLTLKGFKNETLKELAAQVRFAPPPRRLEQLARAERLIAEVETAKHYPYPYVCYRITDFRPDSHADVLISGEDLKEDLLVFIEELAKSMPPMPIETVLEPVLTVEDMSKQLNVSTKTITRWRRRGLIGLPILCKGRRQVGFLPSIVTPFLEAHQAQVDRGSRFSQLTESEKEEILRRAKRLARVPGGTLTEVSRRIARRLKRSAETIRYTIKKYDLEHPSDPLFPAVAPTLDQEAKHAIYSSYRRGISVDTLAKQYGRNRTSVYRVINETRARRLLEQPLDYIHHASFDDPEAEAEILAPMPGQAEFEERRRTLRAPKDAPPELASLYELPLLNKAQEQHLFRKMNFLKYQANRLRAKLDPARARRQQIKQIEDLQARASAVQNRLINCNMRLAVSVSKRYAGQTDNFFELLSDSNMSLIHAVEKFDFSRGFKFSTYATWSIVKNFARSIPTENRRRERYPTGHEEVFAYAADRRADEHESTEQAEQNSYRVNRLLSYLDPREREIVQMRTGLANTQVLTLGEIGEQLGVSKERVRQINMKIMNKLRSIARQQKLDQ